MISINDYMWGSQGKFADAALAAGGIVTTVDIDPEERPYRGDALSTPNNSGMLRAIQMSDAAIVLTGGWLSFDEHFSGYASAADFPCDM